MGEGHKFNPEWAARLNDPARLEILDPNVMWRALAVENPRAIVEIGAGAGLMSVAFARLAPDATVYAADVSAEMLSYLSEHLPSDVEDRVVPVLAEETSVPLADGIADGVAMIALYHELDDPRGNLREAWRLLEPGGRLLIVDWSLEPSEHGPPMEHRVPEEEIRAAVASAGFRLDDEGESPLPGFSVVTATK